MCLNASWASWLSKRKKQQRTRVNVKFEMFPLIWAIYDKFICRLLVSGYFQSIAFSTCCTKTTYRKVKYRWLSTSAGYLCSTTTFVGILFRQQKQFFLHMTHESIRCDLIWLNQQNLAVIAIFVQLKNAWHQNAE